MSDFGFFLVLAILIIFTSGDPDLLDALIKNVSEDCEQQGWSE